MTATYGASASLTFNGTAVWIYGAKRGNHGLYNITLDGHTYRDNGFYDGQVFQQVLFSALGLDGTKSHTVSIVNALTDSTRPFLDVDSVSVVLVTVILDVGPRGAERFARGGRLSIRWRSRTIMGRSNSRILRAALSILHLGGTPTQTTSRATTDTLDSE